MQIANKSKVPKIISGIAATILISFVGWYFLPSFWFWVSFEIVATLLVAIGCSGEWWLHHHPAGKRKKEKDEHHRLESRFIAMVAVGVIMEIFALTHSIREGVILENKVSDAQERTSSNEVKVAFLNQSNLILANRLKDVDPLNAPINSVFATIRLTVKGVTNNLFSSPGRGVFEDPTPENQYKWDIGEITFFQGTDISKQIYRLSFNGQNIGFNGSGLVGGSNDWRGVVIRCQEDNLDEFFPNSFTSPKFSVGQQVGTFNNVGGIVISLPFMKTNVSVVSGTVDVKVNSSRWEFPIPAERAQFGLLTSEIITNANNKVESKIWRVTVSDWSLPARFPSQVFTGE